jgi:hypothetical protein
LRELIWRWQSITYQQEMQAAMIVAGVYNSHRSKASDKVFAWTEFHSEHAGQRRGKTGHQIIQETQQWFAPGEIQWLPGHDPGAE